MSVKRIVDTSFWNDEKVVERFTPEDRYFMLYLLTNPHSTQLGVYQITKRHMAFELGYSVEAVSALIDRFQNRYGIIKYSTETSEVAIKNYLKYSIVKGGKPVEDLLIKELALIKDKSLLRYVYDNIHDCETLNETIKGFLPRLIGEKEKVSQKEKDFNGNVNDNDNEKSYHDSLDESSYDSLKHIIGNKNPMATFFEQWNVTTDDLNGREAYSLSAMDFDKINQAMERSTYLQTQQKARFSTFYIRNYKRIIAGYYDDDKHNPSKSPSKSKNAAEPPRERYDMKAICAEDRSVGLF